jgi:uncharacterized membrane protein YadS
VTLAALGMIGASFAGVLHHHEGGEHGDHGSIVPMIYGVCLCLFLFGIVFITRFLNYPSEFDGVKSFIQRLLLVAGALLLGITMFQHSLGTFGYLLIVFLVLLTVVVFITMVWYRAELEKYRNSPPTPLL